MFAYNLRMAWLSIRKTPGMAALMVGAIGIGIGVSMTMLTIYYMMGKNPIPEKSDVLHSVRLDSWSPDEPADDRNPDEPPVQLTYMDARWLFDQHAAYRETPTYKSFLVVEPATEGLRPETEILRLTGADFFHMFQVPFLYGGPWDAAADAGPEPVVVISRDYNEKVFGGEDSVGRTLTMGSRDFRVVGVLDDWDPQPKFYDLNNGIFEEHEDIYIPFRMVDEMTLWSAGNNNCWSSSEPGWEGRKASECVWIQYWAELRDSAEVAAYQQHLDGYVTEQKALGRFQRPMNNRLYDVQRWLHFNEVVDDDVGVAVGLAAMFLAVCIFNTIGLLLAKFMGKSTETGIRRALGASRKQIFNQQLVEVGLIGVAGGVLGLGLALLGLKGLQVLTIDTEQLVTMDLTMVGAAFLIALVAALLAGLYPAWRVCTTPPATYLKTQ